MTDFIFSKQNLVKSGLFREILQTGIHLETAQKLSNDHLADKFSNKLTGYFLRGSKLLGAGCFPLYLMLELQSL